MTPFSDQGAAQIADDVRHGRRSARSVVEDAFIQIARHEASLNCFTSTARDHALVAAQAIDDLIARGRDPGPLAGVPFAVKNLFDIEGVVTLAGSIIEADKPAAAVNATLVRRLEAAGAVLLGALNMDEYAYGFTTENSHYGPTHNPHDLTRVAGGSSGGSAAAVAGGLAPITLGSDTNGSIRVPAALCGIFGLKPTFGRLSRQGVTSFVHSLDTVGPFARTVRDLALAYDALQGPDPLDPVCAVRPLEPAAPNLDDRPAGLRVAVLGGYFREHAAPEVLSAVDVLADHLAAEPAELPGAKAARAASFCLTAAEGGSLHLSNLRKRPSDFDPGVRERLIAGALQPAWILARAQRQRRHFLEEVRALFQRFDVLLTPATPFPATPIGLGSIEFGGEMVSVRAALGLYTTPFSFIGAPAISLPVQSPGRLPLGVQMVAAPWREGLLLRVAQALEVDGLIGAAPPSVLPRAHRGA